MSLASRERTALCDLFTEVGPDAPTLCEGWDTRDLAAHLHLRETSPLAVGILVTPLAGAMERRQREMASGAWDTLVSRVRRPPWWSPSSIAAVDAKVNGAEYFVHHEDVRRAQPDWEPRALTDSDERALWAVLSSMAKQLYRKAAVPVVLRRPDGAELIAQSGHPAVVVSGPVSELVMHAYGRADQARVTVEGPDELVAAFHETPRAV
ncbi:MAG: TIGR03085 family metal-binding protein [Jiangellales bacterium]